MYSHDAPALRQAEGRHRAVPPWITTRPDNSPGRQYVDTRLSVRRLEEAICREAAADLLPLAVVPVHHDQCRVLHGARNGKVQTCCHVTLRIDRPTVRIMKDALGSAVRTNIHDIMRNE